MGLISDLLFSVTYSGVYNLLLKIIVLFMVSIILFWLVNLIIAKVYKKVKIHRDYFLMLNFITSLVICFFVYNLYLFFYIKLVGIHTFEWTNPYFYLAILNHILLYIIAIILYVVYYTRFVKILKMQR